MNIFKIILDNYKTIKSLVVFIPIIILFNIKNPFPNLQRFAEISVNQIGNEINPDSNIIILKIDQSDIDNLGGWPLRRNYYALIINELRKLNVKVIGFEVFLSKNYSMQNVYDDLLISEIIKSKNVILSSFFLSVENNGEFLFSDSLIYPSIKLKNSSIETGHINFYETAGKIDIPNYIVTNDSLELSFANKIYERIYGENSKQELFRLNIFNSSHKFISYSLLEFFSLIEAESKELQYFEDKIILIGVTDETISKGVRTDFESSIPGIYLHAFALDNLINSRYYKTNYEGILGLAFSVLLLIFFRQYESVRKLSQFIFVTFFYLIVIYFLYKILSFTIRIDIFLVPFILLSVFEIFYWFINKKYALETALSEKELLQKQLEFKEIRIKEYQQKSKNSPHDQKILIDEHITKLREEVNQLKEIQDFTNESYRITQIMPKEFNGIYYASKEIDAVIEVIKKIADSDAGVLITGESGSGKEVVARAIHSSSLRKDRNFIAVNCAALSETLLESELFGHVKGAFTNAIADKKGRFESADKGTIFLDEIGETSENFQVKLLRVLQTGEFEKVGSSETVKSDVRIIAATNKQLEKLISEKKFREDLYYRLNVVKIHIPSLRERIEDIQVLAHQFLKNENSGLNFSLPVLESLRKNEWKGNVRELQSVIKRASIFATSEKRNLVILKDLPDEFIKLTNVELDDLVLESLRIKNFSHSSISETAQEIGKISRNVVTENFRGIFFRFYVNNNFILDETIRKIADNESEEVISKVEAKCSTYLENIKKDLYALNVQDFEEAKELLKSKYKNLPQKFHLYLDMIIQNLIQNA